MNVLNTTELYIWKGQVIYFMLFFITEVISNELKKNWNNVVRNLNARGPLNDLIFSMYHKFFAKGKGDQREWSQKIEEEKKV